MRIFEITDPNELVKLKSKIMQGMNKLDLSDPANEKLLNNLKGVLFGDRLSSSPSDMKDRLSGYQEKILPSGKISQSKTEQDKKKKAEERGKWLDKEIKGLDGIPLEDKYNFNVHVGRNHGINPDIFRKDSQGNLLDTIDKKLKKTQTFQEIKDILWGKKESGQSGMGPGELFIIALTDKAEKSGGANDPDIVIDGTYKVELKMGGIVPFGSGGSNNIIDKLNNDLIDNATKDGIIGHLGNIEYTDSKAGGKGALAPKGVSLVSGWFPQLFDQYKKQNPYRGEQLFNNYFDKLYDGQIPTKIIKSLYINLGTDEAPRILAPAVFRQYQKDKGFDSLCVIDNKFNYVNMTKEQIQSDNFEIPPKIGLTLKMIKGGDTNAVKDGYYVVGIGKNPVVSDNGTESLDDLTTDTEIEQPTKSSKKNSKQQPQQSQLDLFHTPEEQSKIKSSPEFDKKKPNNQLSSKLADPSNPITIAWKQLRPEKQTSAQEEILNLINAGKSDKEIAQQIAQQIEDDIFESQIRRMKQLIG